MPEPTQPQKVKSLDLHQLRRLLHFVRPYRTRLTIAIVVTLSASALGPIRPLLTKHAIDVHIAGGDGTGLLLYALMIAGILLLNGLAQYVLTTMMQWIGQHVLRDIRVRTFEHIQKLSLRFYDTTPVGRLVTRVTNDIEALNELFSSGVVMILSDSLVIVWIISLMLYTDWRLALLTLSVLPVLFVAATIFRRRVRAAYDKIRVEIARMNSFLNEFISGIVTVQIFNQEKNMVDRFKKTNRTHRDLQDLSIYYYAIFFPVVEMLSAIAMGIVLWYSTDSIRMGVIGLGTIVAFLQFVEMFFRPVRSLTENYNTLQSALSASERIFTILDEKTFDGALASYSNDPSTNTQLLQCPPLQHSIELRNVRFRYSDEKEILKGIDLLISKSKTLALVGTTGAGKTSIANVLTRFYPIQSGGIYWDGTSISEFHLPSLRNRIAVVQQDFFMFAGSILDNITLGREGISRVDAENVIRALGADSFISKLPQGIDTVLGERGAMLSTGQKQIISFCRALASKPDLLILDEATSNVDSETESLVELAIQKLLSMTTSIVIAHRLSTIQRAHTIAVLHHGEIMEQGTHSELLRKGGFYSKLYNLQFPRTSEATAKAESPLH